RLESERLQPAGRALQAGAAEPAEQLLRTVAGQQPAERNARDEEARIGQQATSAVVGLLLGILACHMSPRHQFSPAKFKDYPSRLAIITDLAIGATPRRARRGVAPI